MNVTSVDLVKRMRQIANWPLAPSTTLLDAADALEAAEARASTAESAGKCTKCSGQLTICGKCGHEVR